MMRVTDWHRWQRTKMAVAGLLFIIALMCVGGAEEPDAYQPIPSMTGFMISMTLCVLLIINIYRKGTRQ